jgi:hypothetical protein
MSYKKNAEKQASEAEDAEELVMNKIDSTNPPQRSQNVFLSQLDQGRVPSDIG